VNYGINAGISFGIVFVNVLEEGGAFLLIELRAYQHP
jgi:hypothetical protein